MEVIGQVHFKTETDFFFFSFTRTWDLGKISGVYNPRQVQLFYARAFMS